MVVNNIIEFIENWAPPGAAWEKDNVGLQVGSVKQKVTNIMLCLELTEKVLIEAIKKKSNFIFTHHPFLFKPLKKINTYSDPKGKLIEQLIKNDITLYSAHTNLDFTKEGVSFELAKSLKLNDQKFLVNEKSNQFKLVVFVPQNELDKVAKALFDSGAGIIGEYKNCSFNLNGVGTFEGSENSNPKIGTKQKFKKVNEARLEVLVDSWKLNKVLKSLKETHPYEEPAFDVYPLQNENVNYGYGVIGDLPKSMNPNEFMTHVCNSLKINDLRFAKGKGGKIKKVAVCGGSGSELLDAAIGSGADAFVTADLKYHTFQDGENRILFIDAGHYETEILALNTVKRKLEEFIKKNGESVSVYKFSGSTNPIRFFNNKGVK
ncbi:MAG: Nif3-like dinuclear metal center hexameric protein [Ignavibacteriae bacterium]|nr:Nif3-like dinuclear metal center hexameric protein [Ignavibacteriota bacterium]